MREITKYCLVIWYATVVTTASASLYCEYYNETLCNSNSLGLGCNGTEECKPNEDIKKNLCYILWQNSSDGLSIKLKGCWVGNHRDCSSETPCMETRRESKLQLFFCCCEGDLCTRHMNPSSLILLSSMTAAAKPITSIPIKLTSSGSQVISILMCTLIPFVGLTLITVVAYWVYRNHRMLYFNEVPTAESLVSPLPSPLLGSHPIQLIEVKAQGRFGSVWKARILNVNVAVKIFPPQDKNSWFVEQEIYRLPQMKHENILTWMGVEKHGDSMHSEYWLITAYHEKGSLCDYLKANLITWKELLSIAISIAKGLTHLHEELPPRKGEGYKPSIAHRDFKSKNVLLKRDMTACIADFGLALVFYQGQSPRDAQGQVGTRRYMAPEVLEGAVNFNKDAFLRIDMYACGLVLWELISRCCAQEGPVGEYLLPFEEEIGQHPTLEDMQEVVVQKKFRPKFNKDWKKYPGLAAVCDTAEDCWDHDAEARVSASCVLERLSLLTKSQSSISTNNISTVPEPQRNASTSNIKSSAPVSEIDTETPQESTI
ncbi:activin receptor type-2A-like [Centruroides sculpturatus]|uniref:activin receptor type-2A-like n=1 Tax=Centruroides sculpturatus TaxID=218467 RepID=UPI000C6E8A71|nr:activin receptor type-2A-like [Centruroides sculpturatus]